MFHLTLSLVHEGEESRQAQDSTENETGGDRHVGDDGEPLERVISERGIDEVGVVVANKGYTNKQTNDVVYGMKRMLL